MEIVLNQPSSSYVNKDLWVGGHGWMTLVIEINEVYSTNI